MMLKVLLVSYLGYYHPHMPIFFFDQSVKADKHRRKARRDGKKEDENEAGIRQFQTFVAACAVLSNSNFVDTYPLECLHPTVMTSVNAINWTESYGDPNLSLWTNIGHLSSAFREADCGYSTKEERAALGFYFREDDQGDEGSVYGDEGRICDYQGGESSVYEGLVYI